MYLYSKHKDDFICIKSCNITSSYNSHSSSFRYKVMSSIDVTVTMDLLDFSYMRDMENEQYIKDNIILYDGNKYYNLIGSYISNIFYDDYQYEAVVSLLVDLFEVNDKLPSEIFQKLRNSTIDNILDI